MGRILFITHTYTVFKVDMRSLHPFSPFAYLPTRFDSDISRFDPDISRFDPSVPLDKGVVKPMLFKSKSTCPVRCISTPAFPHLLSPSIQSCLHPRYITTHHVKYGQKA